MFCAELSVLECCHVTIKVLGPGIRLFLEDYDRDFKADFLSWQKLLADIFNKRSVTQNHCCEYHMTDFH